MILSMEWEFKHIPMESNTLEIGIEEKKKELFLDVSQSIGFVLPNTEYEYHVYVKNTSLSNIENVKVFIASPKEVIINTECPEIKKIDENHVKATAWGMVFEGDKK